MVRANCANRNVEIHTPLPSPPPARRSTSNAPSPAAGGGTGCALALGPAEGGRAWGRCARVSDAHPRDARPGRFRSRVGSEDTDERDTDKRELRRRRRVSDLRRQGPRAKIS